VAGKVTVGHARTGHASDTSGSPPMAKGLEYGDKYRPMLSSRYWRTLPLPYYCYIAHWPL